MTILYDSARPVNRRRPFGLGVIVPARERRAPFAAADREWAAANLNAGAGHASDEEWADELERRTLSPAEYRALRADAAAAAAGRYARSSEAERSEVGMTAAGYDRLAEEAAALDAHERGYTFA